MDNRHKENIHIDSFSDEQTVVLNNRVKQDADDKSVEERIVLSNRVIKDDADGISMEVLLPEHKNVDLILDSSSNYTETVRSLAQQSEKEILQDSMVPPEVEQVDLEPVEHEDETMRAMLKRIEKLEDRQSTFQKCQQENFIKIWDQFSSMQGDFDQVLYQIQVKLDRLELAVVNSYTVYEKEIQHLKQKLEILEHKYLSQTNENSFQNPSQQVMRSCGEEKTEYSDSGDKHEQMHKAMLREIRGIREHDCQATATFHGPPATCSSLEPKCPEITVEARDRKECVEEALNEPNQNLEDKKEGDQDQDEEERMKRNFQRQWQKTTEKLREFIAEEQNAKREEPENQLEGAEEKYSVPARDPTQHPDEAGLKVTSAKSDEDETAGGGDEESDTDEQTLDKSQDADPKVNQFQVCSRMSNKPENYSK